MNNYCVPSIEIIRPSRKVAIVSILSLIMLIFSVWLTWWWERLGISSMMHMVDGTVQSGEMFMPHQGIDLPYGQFVLILATITLVMWLHYLLKPRYWQKSVIASWVIIILAMLFSLIIIISLLVVFNQLDLPHFKASAKFKLGFYVVNLASMIQIGCLVWLLLLGIRLRTRVN